MRRPPLTRLLLLLLVPAALLASGCGGGAGGNGVELASSNPQHEGAQIFNQRCGACHTLAAAGTHGSSTEIGSIEYKDGPNLNAKLEDYRDVLYAIRNGGFSGQQMPANIVTGEEAEKVACFVSTYSGTERPESNDPGAQQEADTADCAAKLGEG